tara:strand:+ start:702 stop:1328 length:627 start_codon:yes stop_codon:yes gene_type:complete
MNQIAIHNAFALPEFNNHVTLFDYNVRTPHTLAATEYKRKARRARMKAAAYVQPEPVKIPVGVNGVIFIKINKLGKKHYLRDHKFDHHVKLQILHSIQRPNSGSWSVEKIQKWCLSSDLSNGVVTVEAGKFTITDIKSERQFRELVLVRQLAVYFSKKFTLLSTPSIGRIFGNRDHTTILHSIRKIEGLIEDGKLIMNGEVVTKSTEL